MTAFPPPPAAPEPEAPEAEPAASWWFPGAWWVVIPLGLCLALASIAPLYDLFHGGPPPPTALGEAARKTGELAVVGITDALLCASVWLIVMLILTEALWKRRFSPSWRWAWLVVAAVLGLVGSPALPIVGILWLAWLIWKRREFTDFPKGL